MDFYESGTPFLSFTEPAIKVSTAKLNEPSLSETLGKLTWQLGYCQLSVL